MSGSEVPFFGGGFWGVGVQQPWTAWWWMVGPGLKKPAVAVLSWREQSIRELRGKLELSSINLYNCELKLQEFADDDLSLSLIIYIYRAVRSSVGAGVLARITHVKDLYLLKVAGKTAPRKTQRRVRAQGFENTDGVRACLRRVGPFVPFDASFPGGRCRRWTRRTRPSRL